MGTVEVERALERKEEKKRETETGGGRL